jgi:hypothetical protein
MATQTNVKYQQLNVSDLQQMGFNEEEIRGLLRLRAWYHPTIEQMDTHAEWRRIQFLRWLYQNGVYPRG